MTHIADASDNIQFPNFLITIVTSTKSLNLCEFKAEFKAELKFFNLTQVLPLILFFLKTTSTKAH